jgi:hypothetical protein
LIDPKLTVKIDAFNGAMRAMQQQLARSGATMQGVIDYEVAKIIEAALSRTDAATAASIRRSQDARGPWMTADLWRGKKKYFLENRYSDVVWGKIQQRLAETLRRKIAARGFAKQSWLNLALLLGFTIRAPGYVAKATVPNVNNMQNVDVKRTTRSDSYELYIEDRSPLLQWANGRQAFFSAIAGREKFLRTNLAKGVFNDLAQVAKKYPGLVVTQGPS